MSRFVEIPGSGRIRVTTPRDVSRARESRMQAMGDPLPGPGIPSGYSGGSLQGRLIKLVGSMGRARAATYRAIYMMNPWVYASVHAISDSIGRLPLQLFQLDADGNRQRIRSDVPQTPGRPNAGVALDRLLQNPCAGQSRQSFIAATMIDRLVHGNALWEIERDTGGPPTGFCQIAWSRVTHIQEDRDGRPVWYEIAGRNSDSFGGGTGKRTILAPNAIHFGLGADPDYCWNISILESCQHTLALHEAMMRHLMGYFENSMRPSGMFEAESAKAAREARQLITELYTSPENAGKVLVTNAKWQSMSDSPDHAQIVELVQESRIEVVAAFHIPPPIIGILEHAIRSNVKELREQMGRDTIGPWASDFEGELEAQLLAPNATWSSSSYFTEFQLAEMLRPDLEARALVYQRLMWIYAIDEIRGFENRPPFNIKGVTDVPWVASGAMPVTIAAKGKPAVAPPRAPGASSEEPSLHEISALLTRLDALEANGNGHHELSEVT